MAELDKYDARMNDDEFHRLMDAELQTFMEAYSQETLFELFDSLFTSVQDGQEDSAVEEQLQKLGVGELEIVWLKTRAASNSLSLCKYTVGLLQAFAYSLEEPTEIYQEDDLGPGIQEKSRDFSRDDDLSR